MLYKIFSSATSGIDDHVVEVKADVQQQLLSFVTVGLHDGNTNHPARSFWKTKSSCVVPFV